MKQSLREPRKHQARALEYCRGMKAPAFYMEMRLGKTLPAIRWAQEVSGKHLVVAPLTVLQAWEEELQLEGVALAQITYLVGSSARKAALATGGRGWYLVGYEALRACPAILRAGFSTIICDESTKIRNPQAQITKLLTTSCPISRRAILSGLPNPESALDFYSQFAFLDGHFMGFKDYWAFRDTLYYLPRWSQWDWMPRPGTTAKIKEYVQKRAFVLTRKDAGVDCTKVYEKRFVPMNALQKRLYKKIEDEFAWGDNEDEATKWATTKFVWLSRIAGGFDPVGKECISTAKAEEIARLLKEELQGQKLIVWFCFNAELDMTAKFLREKGFKVRRVTGEESLDERKAATMDLRLGKAQVILAQVKCGKFGLNWSCADTAIYYSNRYDGEDRAQSEDRTLDTSKQEPLLYIDLITENSLDVDVIATLREKWRGSRFFMTDLLKHWANRRGL